MQITQSLLSRVPSKYERIPDTRTRRTRAPQGGIRTLPLGQRGDARVLRLLEERDKREELRNAIRKGLDSGPAEPLDMEAVKAEARNRLSPPVKLIRVFL